MHDDDDRLRGPELPDPDDDLHQHDPDEEALAAVEEFIRQGFYAHVLQVKHLLCPDHLKLAMYRVAESVLAQLITRGSHRVSNN